MSTIAYVSKIFDNLTNVDSQQIEAVYHDLRSAGAIIPAGEGRSKGALSIACSELAKMSHGKVIIDRGDVGFPGRDLEQAAPVLRKRYGQVCLLINSGSGRSMMPLIDAQKLGYHIVSGGNARDFRMDLITSEPDSPLGKLSAKYGNLIELKGREAAPPTEAREFRNHGIMEDLFTLGSGLLFQSMAEAMVEESAVEKIPKIQQGLFSQIEEVVNKVTSSEFFSFQLETLEERRCCFLAGLGSSQEVARMTAVRIGHVKRAIGDQVYVAGDTNTPPPRPGDTLLVVSNSGETEVVAAWCRNFKKMGGKIASYLGTPKSTIESLSDFCFVDKSNAKAGMPNSFYIKAAFALSPLPIYLIERVEERGLRLPEYIIRWHRSVIS